MSNFTEKLSGLQITQKWRIWTAISVGIVFLAAIIVTFFNFNLAPSFVLSGSVDVNVGSAFAVDEDKYEEFEAIVFEVLDEFEIDYSPSKKLYISGALSGMTVTFSATINGNEATEEQLDIIGILINGKQDVEFAENAEILVNRATGEQVSKLKTLLSGTTAYQKLSANGDFDKGKNAVAYKGIHNRIEEAGIELADLNGNPVAYPISSLQIIAGSNTAQQDFKLFWNFLLVFGIAVVVMFLFVLLRFGLRSAIVSAAVSLHNIILVTALAAITRIVLDATFATVLAISTAVVAYVIALVFEKIKENREKTQNADWTTEEIADNSVKQNILPFAIVLFGGLFVLTLMLVASLIAALPAVSQFILPVMLCLIASGYSVIFITPCAWVYTENLFAQRRTNDKKIRTKDSHN